MVMLLLAPLVGGRLVGYLSTSQKGKSLRLGMYKISQPRTNNETPKIKEYYWLDLDQPDNSVAGYGSLSQT